MKTVEDIAKIWKQKAAQAIYPGLKSSLVTFRTKPLSKAYKTGNLLRQFVKENANNTFTKVKLKNGESYEMILKIAPQGAFYGRFVHNGTVKMGARPYVEIGGQDDAVQNAVKEFMDSLPKKALEEQKEKIQKILAPFKQ